MDNAWLISRIWTTFDNTDRIVLDLIRPTVERFMQKIETFHFFREREHLLFRVMCGEPDAASIRAFIEERLIEMRDRRLISNYDPIRIDPTYSEENDYGPDNWENVYKFFEYGSRLSIRAIEYRSLGAQPPTQFHEGKFVHCFLNQWGYHIEGEARFHLRRVGERLLLLLSNMDREVTERFLPEVRRRLELEIYPTIVAAINEIIRADEERR